MKISRRVQKSGNSTYTISLPKEWCEHNHIERHSELILDISEYFITIIPTTKKIRIKAEIDATDKSITELFRYFIGAYLGGYDIIVIKTNNIDIDKKEKIKQFSQRVAGIEIVEEDARIIVFQDFFNLEELSIDKAIKRTHKLIHNMEKDAVSSVLELDKHLAEDVIHRDKEVDRINLLVRRQITKTLLLGHTGIANIETRKTIYYFIVIKTLERIADHCTKIASNTLSLRKKLDKRLTMYLLTLNNNILSNLQKSILSFLNAEARICNQIIEDEENLREKISEFRKKILISNYDAKIEINTIIDSLERIIFLITDIAEAGIDVSI